VPVGAVFIVNSMSNPNAPEAKKLSAFAIIYNFRAFALSGLLEGYGFEKLENSGIWADNPTMTKLDKDAAPCKKDLTPFFEYLERKVRVSPSDNNKESTE